MSRMSASPPQQPAPPPATMESSAVLTSPGSTSPPVVRPRPKLPSLAKSRSGPSAIRKTPSDPNTEREKNDIASVIGSLSATDFITKYSRRIKRIPSGGQGGDGDSPSTTSSCMSPVSSVNSPGPNTPPMESRAVGTITLTRMKSIRLKLEKVRENQEKIEAGRTNMPRRRSGVVEAPKRSALEHQLHKMDSPDDVVRIESTGNNNELQLGVSPCYTPECTTDLSASTLSSSEQVNASSSLTWSTVTSAPVSTDTVLTTCAHANSVDPSYPTDDLRLETQLYVTEDAETRRRRASPLRQGDSTSHRPVRQECQDLEDEGVGEGDHDANLYKNTLASVVSKPPPAPSDPLIRPSTLETAATCTVHFYEDHPKRLQRQNAEQRGSIDNSPNGGKMANGRFMTHPPIKDRSSSKESGSVDSNGLGSLREGMEPSSPLSDLSAQASVVSIDSHYSPSDASEMPSYHDVIIDVTSATDADKFERRNNRSFKIKSKSDPSGEKSRKEGSETKPVLGSHTHSSPLLMDDQNLHPDDALQVQGDRSKSKSENMLSPGSRKGSPSPVRGAEGIRKMNSVESEDEHHHSPSRLSLKHRWLSRKKHDSGASQSSLHGSLQAQSSQEDDYHDTSEDIESDSRSRDEDSEEERPDKVQSKSRLRGLRFHTMPVMPDDLSPDSTLEKMSTLTIPSPTKKSSLGRSHSTASGLSTKQRARPKELLQARANLRSTSYSTTDLPSPKGKDRNTSLATYSPKLEPIHSGSTLSLFDGPVEEMDKRDLIVEELANTEKQYVDTLHMLVEKYMIPMKTHGLLDSNLVDDIFYKINEIYMHHATFQAFLEGALRNWDSQTTIGDVILKTFSKQTVIECYTSFIDNFPRAEKVLDDLSTKSSFQKFIEQIERETRNKLPLKAQIVKPAQRIPRYELLIKRLREYTDEDHPDHRLLLQAEKAIHNLALKINNVKESKNQEDLHDTLKKLELLLITDLVSPDRLYLRHDMVQVLSRKDQCCVWLFSDLVIFTAIKRKSGPVNRKSTLLLQSPMGQDFVENTKHKVWMKMPLEDIEVIKNGVENKRRLLVDRDILEEDSNTLQHLHEIANKLNTAHQLLDEAIRDLQSQVNKQLSEHQLKPPPPDACKVELVSTSSQGGVIQITMVFPTPEKKASWDVTFSDAKHKLSLLTDGKPPEFLHPLQITKTRAGMQFSCAAPIEGVPAGLHQDVWVCNSDGYVGHMCLLSLQPEPIVTLNTPVPGCNSRILCICAVPGIFTTKKKTSLKRKRRHHSDSSRTPHGSGRHSELTSTMPRIKVESLSVSSNADEDEDGYGSHTDSTMSDTEEDEDDGITLHLQPDEGSRSPSPAGSMVNLHHSGILRESPLVDPLNSTMWLGTEDGCIHIFLTNENIKTTKNKAKLQQAAGVLSIVHQDQKVFVSLANGDLIVYKRAEEGAWDLEGADTLTLGSPNAPITKMQAVAGKLWCACHDEIVVLNTSTLRTERKFTIDIDGRKSIQSIVCSGQAVWLAGQGSAKVHLYHATSYQHLLTVNVTHVVSQKLQTADDIIRQHKTACLRVTTLLICKDLLWVGTSAGVLLTVPMPKVSSHSEPGTLTLPQVTGLAHGHTGHVRFLTCVELPSNKLLDTPPKPSHLARRASASLHTVTLATKMLVISGGDGYEDFRNTNIESAGKDDSTNHLLLWQV